MLQTTTGEVRRPIGHKPAPTGPEPDTNLATFLSNEDAREAGWARFGIAPYRHVAGEWSWGVAFWGYLDRWVINARRKSWSSAREVYLLRDGALGQPER